MQDSFSLVSLVLLAFTVSIPCGYVRESFKKFSLFWLLAAHLPIPMVYHMRQMAGFDWHVIPLTLASAIGGQMLGGWYKRRVRNGRKTSQRQP